jgi:hypothetical protein
MSAVLQGNPQVQLAWALGLCYATTEMTAQATLHVLPITSCR